MQMKNRNVSSVALAAAAALMFSTVAVTAFAAEEANVKCEGVNSCKGKSACKTASSSCKGMNECAGKGFVEMTKAECEAAMAKMKQKKQQN